MIENVAIVELVAYSCDEDGREVIGHAWSFKAKRPEWDFAHDFQGQTLTVTQALAAMQNCIATFRLEA